GQLVLYLRRDRGEFQFLGGDVRETTCRRRGGDVHGSADVFLRGTDERAGADAGAAESHPREPAGAGRIESGSGGRNAAGGVQDANDGFREPGGRGTRMRLHLSDFSGVAFALVWGRSEADQRADVFDGFGGR